MPNSPIDAVGHELVVLPQIQTDRPIPAERTMRQVEHYQSPNRENESQPGRDRMEGVSGELGNSRGHVKERYDAKTGKGYEQQQGFPPTPGAQYNLFAARAAGVFVAYEIPADYQRDEHRL